MEVMFNMRRLGGTAWEMRRANDFALAMGTVMCLTVTYAMALFGARIARAYFDRSILQCEVGAGLRYCRGRVTREPLPAEVQTPRMWPVFGRLTIISEVVLIVVALLAILGSCITPHSLDVETSPDGPHTPPVWLEGGDLNHPLGTDFSGRDVLSLIIAGARYTLTVAAGAIAVCALTSVIAVGAAVYYGGFVDRSLTSVASVHLRVSSSACRIRICLFLLFHFLWIRGQPGQNGFCS